MNQELIIVQTTVNQSEIAQSIATQIVEKGLAACAQIEGPILSIYPWKHQIQSEQEWRIQFKTTPDNLPSFEKHLTQLHPYEIPEIIALSPIHVTPNYLQWARSSLNHQLNADN